MNHPAGYELRAPNREDLGAVAGVLMADQREDGSEPVLDATFIRREWSRSSLDLATDAWVVTDDVGAIVAYGQVRPDEPDAVESWGVVHPEHRGRGIGSLLLDRIEARASVLLAGIPSPRFRHSISAADRAAAAMLRARGLRPVRHFWHMQVDPTRAREPGQAPDAIDVSEIESSDDLRAIHDVLKEAFADDPGAFPPPLDRWVEDYTRQPSDDSTIWLLARDAGVLVGALVGSEGDDGGWVDGLGVVASHRGRGIGAALLRRSFAAFAARGLRRVLLNVDAENATGATALYEGAGMRIVSRWDLWERSSADPP